MTDNAPRIHPTAVIDPAARRPTMSVGAFTLIGPDVEIGAGTVVGPIAASTARPGSAATTASSVMPRSVASRRTRSSAASAPNW